MPSNFERWLDYTSGLTSPQNYVDWTWRYIVSASLQRRVFLPPEHRPCFANLYVVPVGRAGLGKGLMVTEASDFLRHWKLKDALLLNRETFSLEEKNKVNTIHQMDVEKAQDAELQPKNSKNSAIEPILIPVAANATTYEALVQAVAESYRRINFVDNSGDKPKLGTYGH